MRVHECMTKEVKVINPEKSIKEAASLMAALDIGVLPVGENDRLVGMITDRDIVVRALSAGKPPETPVREIMSEEILYCFDDEDLRHVARNMGEQKVRRLPVMNRSKRLVGIVSIGDVANSNVSHSTIGDALCEISEPEGLHSHTAESRAARH